MSKFEVFVKVEEDKRIPQFLRGEIISTEIEASSLKEAKKQATINYGQGVVSISQEGKNLSYKENGKWIDKGESNGK